MANRWIQYMPDELRSKLTKPDMVALDLLEAYVFNSESIEEVAGGCLLARKGHVEVTLDVVGSLFNFNMDGDAHMYMTVGIKGHRSKLQYEVCILCNEDFPAADSFSSFVWMVNSGWPEEIVPQPLLEAIEDANNFAVEQASFVQLAEECAGGLISLTADARLLRETAQVLYDRAFSDAISGVGITWDLLLRTVRAAAECVRGGLDVDGVNMAINQFLARYSPFTINAMICQLNSTSMGEPMAEILTHFKRYDAIDRD